MIRMAKGLELMKIVYIIHLNIFGSKMFLTMKIMDFENVKVVDLDIICLYNRNHMVGMDKISSNENSTQNLLLEEMLCNHYITCLYFVNMHNFLIIKFSLW